MVDERVTKMSLPKFSLKLEKQLKTFRKPKFDWTSNNELFVIDLGDMYQNAVDFDLIHIKYMAVDNIVFVESLITTS